VRCLYNKCQGVMVVCSCAQKPIPVSSRVAPTLGPDESFPNRALRNTGIGSGPVYVRQWIDDLRDARAGVGPVHRSRTRAFAGGSWSAAPPTRLKWRPLTIG